MTLVATAVWQSLANDRPTGDLLRAMAAIHEFSSPLLAAVDSGLTRRVLVPLQAGEAGFRDVQTRGLRVQTLEVDVPGQPSNRYIDVACLEATGHPALDIIGGEIADGLRIEGAKPADVVRRVIARWRRFWANMPLTALSWEEHLGLFAEIWFLSEWLLPNHPVAESVAAWRGPYGARHDFEWLGRSVEVKASSSVRGSIHRIHGLEQLAAPETGDLLFFSVQLREEAGASNTLPALIASCRARIGDDSEVLDRLESGLALAGYSPAHDDEYNKVRLRISGQALFRVEEGFPRLTTANFPGGVPAGVERVEYDVNLAACTHLLIATTPGPLPPRHG